MAARDCTRLHMAARDCTRLRVTAHDFTWLRVTTFVLHWTATALDCAWLNLIASSDAIQRDRLSLAMRRHTQAVCLQGLALPHPSQRHTTLATAPVYYCCAATQASEAALSLAAALSVRSPFVAPFGMRANADEAKVRTYFNVPQLSHVATPFLTTATSTATSPRVFQHPTAVYLYSYRIIPYHTSSYRTMPHPTAPYRIIWHHIWP